MNKKMIIMSLSFLLIFSINFNFVQAEEFTSPEEFAEFIYLSYSAEEFEKVYNYFVPELKNIISQDEYLDFQQSNFDKYDLEYSNIEVDKAVKINFDELKSQFDYAEQKGDYYQLSIGYLLKFNRFGHRERESDNKVFLRKIGSDFQLFWNPDQILNEEDAESQVDSID